MKQDSIIRAIQLEMADALLDFCDEHRLSIWAGYGTLLGAVRHRGFIPWDDDMDFMMLREDFDRLRELAKTIELPKPLAFDINRVDVIKIKNSNTTQIAVSKLSHNENYGIWIDIWCLDSMPEREVSDKEYRRIRNKLRIVSNASQMCYASSKGISSFLFHTYCLLYTGLLGKQRLFNSIESDIKHLKGDALVNFMVFSRMKKNTSYTKLKKYSKAWLLSTIQLPFEDRSFPCPAGYHEVLTAQYGDYMTPVKDGASHNTSTLDVNRPYKVVVEELLSNLPWYRRIFRIL